MCSFLSTSITQALIGQERYVSLKLIALVLQFTTSQWTSWFYHSPDYFYAFLLREPFSSVQFVYFTVRLYFVCLLDIRCDIRFYCSSSFPFLHSLYMQFVILRCIRFIHSSSFSLCSSYTFYWWCSSTRSPYFDFTSFVFYTAVRGHIPFLIKSVCFPHFNLCQSNS